MCAGALESWGWVSEVQVCALSWLQLWKDHLLSLDFRTFTHRWSFSVSKKKKKDDSINVSRIDGLKEEIRKKGMNEHRV